MASEALFLGALTLLVLGSGCLLGNMLAQVGLLYAPKTSAAPARSAST
jgi:POT family proton-dependent oligopeptide transporter